MARCGCNAASATTCDAIVLCVAANLGPGLRYNTVSGQLAVRLSGDSGNAASFGSDSGLYVPGPDTPPDPAAGRKTIAGLPERAFCANQGGGGSMLPFGSPHGIEYAVANRMDMISFHTFALADGVAINRVTTPYTALHEFTDNPSSIAWEQLSSVQLPSLNVDAGTRVNPTGTENGAPPSLETPYGGWFGFYARQYAPITLAEALHRLAARAVAYMACFGGFDEEQISRNVDAAVRAVLQVQAQDWAIVGFSPYVDDGTGTIIVSPLWPGWAADIAASGVTPAVDLFEDDDGGGQVSPADVIAAGVEWVRFKITDAEGGTALSRVQEFIDAGLQVMVQTDSRQFSTQRAYNMGVRVVMCDSPVYARGGRGETGDLDYRKTVVIPGLVTRTSMEGSLTRRTNDGWGRADAGWARQSTPGRYFGARFAWDGGIGPRINAQLLGEICPHETPSSWRLRVRFRVDPTQTEVPTGISPKLGMFTCAPTDRDITTFDDGTGPELNSWVNGYWSHVRVGSSRQGEVTLGKVTDGDYEVLEESESFPSINYGDWIYMSFSVTPTDVTLAVRHNTLPDDIIYTVADTTHRGPYAFYGWEDTHILPADNQGFVHGYSAYENYEDGFPMWEDLT